MNPDEPKRPVRLFALPGPNGYHSAVRRLRLTLLILALGALLVSPLWAQPAPGGVQSRRLTLGDAAFTVVTVDLERATLRLHWKDPTGKPFLTFQALEDHLSARGEKLLAVTNAGIYEKTHRPLGLHVENGQTLRPINRRTNGYGNFYLQPNGVFFLERSGFGKVRARILSTRRFAASAPAALEATQSGPLLVEDGKINASFRQNSANRLIRNAVGVESGTRVHLVIAETPVNFYDLARFFRDTLKSKNALYLDGNVSSLYVPGEGGTDAGGFEGGFGGMIAIVGR